MSKEKSIKFLETRKSLTVLPLLAFPFLCLVFWALDGGSGTSKEKAGASKSKGINMQLPEASINENGSTDKMSIYDQARRDSMSIQSDRDRDIALSSENENPSTTVEDIGDDLSVGYGIDNGRKGKKRGLNYSPVHRKDYVDPNEAKVNEKLKELYRGLKQSYPDEREGKINDDFDQKERANNEEIKELTKMVKDVYKDDGNGNNGKDPEMEQISSVLDKILDAQHPERVKNRLKEQSAANEGVVYHVSTEEKDAVISFINQSRQDTLNKTKKRNGFFGLINAQENIKEAANAIEAVIHASQTLVSGSVVKIRLLNDIFINGQRIPKNNFVYGFASISGERLNISVNSVRYLNSIFPINLTVYDMDGLAGIYIPGAIERDYSKDALVNGVQQLDYPSTSVDPSVTQQVTAGVISGVKGIFSTKVKLNKVNVKANYKILLLDANSQ